VSDRGSADTVQAATTVPISPQRAFAVFTEGLGTWWPSEFTWSQGALESIRMDPRQGGLCSEEGPHGFRMDWGRVLTWEPPHRVVFSWQISPDRVPEPDPEKASQVEVRFVEQDATSIRVELSHSGFARHGKGGDAYRAAMAEQGWPYLLERYAAAAATR
jgi:uncharacterized protein YndB with AHSA1/START domain